MWGRIFSTGRESLLAAFTASMMFSTQRWIKRLHKQNESKTSVKGVVLKSLLFIAVRWWIAAMIAFKQRKEATIRTETGKIKYSVDNNVDSKRKIAAIYL